MSEAENLYDGRTVTGPYQALCGGGTPTMGRWRTAWTSPRSRAAASR